MNLEDKCKALVDEYRTLNLQQTISDSDKIRIKQIDADIDDVVEIYRFYAYKIADIRFSNGAKYPADRYFPSRLKTPTIELLSGDGDGVILIWDDEMVLTVTFEEIRRFFTGEDV